MNEVKFFKCSHCGTIVEKINDTGLPMVCCGEVMERIMPGISEASAEKHIPEVKITDNRVWVKAGAVDHPMTEEHFIQWVCLLTDKGVYRKHLTPGKMPTATFLTVNETPIAVYAYCNLHGLWMANAEVAPVIHPVKEEKNTSSENYTVCFCNQVRYFDIENAIYDNTNLGDVLAIFEKVKDTTHCSGGCGGCHDKVVEIISQILMGS